MNTAEEHGRLREAIVEVADPEYREGSLMVAPTAQRVYGVRTPDLRRLAKAWRRDHREAGTEEVLTLVESLWAAESRDERMLGLEILRLNPGIVAGLEQRRFDRWRGDIDNWGVCDFLAMIVGTWVASNPDRRLAYLEQLVGNPDVWSRRLGLVATVVLNRDSDPYGAWTLGQVDRVLHERDPMITKAVSWVLRTMTKHAPRSVADYAEANAERLAALPRREVRNKLRTGRKSGRSG